MEPIFPLQEERIQPFCGNLVCVLMKDGTRHVGVLSSCGKGKVILNGGQEGGPGGKLYLNGQHAGGSKPSGSRKRGKSGQKAETQAYPYGYGGPGYYYGPRYPFGGELILDLALIAFLFLLL